MFKKYTLSIKDIVGDDLAGSIKNGAILLHDMKPSRVDALLEERVDMSNETVQARNDSLLHEIGKQVCPALQQTDPGASTISYNKATKTVMAPVGGVGCLRLGEDGKLYLAAKSEHYQIAFGHGFSGYRLITLGRELGIINATHNNTRGYITRSMEREIVRVANGLEKGDPKLNSIVQCREAHILNRVINLETGSLACEAAIKMMLSRFYVSDLNTQTPDMEGKTPVFLVIGDYMGGIQANYHGTTVFAQLLRGSWAGMKPAVPAFEVVGVNINDVEDFKAKIHKYNQGSYKTAGFIHEIVLMNYGGILLDKDYLKRAYELCREYDTPVMCDEIQSCMWYGGMFLFKKYGLNPDFVIVGKGFPGGEYPASKVITTYQMDRLAQFGALVTNGQEELASLAYLIGMNFAEANCTEIDAMGTYIDAMFQRVCERYPALQLKAEGKGHLAALHFDNVADAIAFVHGMNERCVDVSAQTYKANCPPAALFKLPLVADKATVDALYAIICAALDSMTEAAK